MSLCGVCSRDVAEGQGEVLTLSDEEKAYARRFGQDPPDTYVYCKPCFKVISDPESSAQLASGTLLARLRASGVANAEKIAKRYYEELVARAKPRP
jgi:hypothetical protein